MKKKILGFILACAVLSIGVASCGGVKEETCVQCQGTGQCSTCNGSGKLNAKDSCYSCRGSGKCYRCKGTGKYKY